MFALLYIYILLIKNYFISLINKKQLLFIKYNHNFFLFSFEYLLHIISKLKINFLEYFLFYIHIIL